MLPTILPISPPQAGEGYSLHSLDYSGRMVRGQNGSASHELDTRGLKCPLPVLKARKALLGVPIGDVLIILATDLGAPSDFEHFCSTTGNELVSTGAESD